MRGADTVNDEFEVGFNQRFESQWYRAELSGRLIMVVFVTCAALGLMGRGPFSHHTVSSDHGEMRVDYEPIARHSTATMVTVHLRNDSDTERPLSLTLNQQLIEPIGYQHATPAPDVTKISNSGIQLGFIEQPNQNDMLVRFNLTPNALGFIPMEISNGRDTVRWRMLVVP